MGPAPAAARGRVGLALLAVATAGLWLLGTHAAETYLIGRLTAVHPIPADEDVARIDVVVVLSGGFVDAPAAAYDQPDSVDDGPGRPGRADVFRERRPGHGRQRPVDEGRRTRGCGVR